MIDLGAETPLATLWFYDMNNSGDVLVHAGKPGAWQAVATYDCKRYKSWGTLPLNVRDFNANFLALPALPSQRVDKGCSDPAVALRVAP